MNNKSIDLLSMKHQVPDRHGYKFTDMAGGRGIAVPVWLDDVRNYQLAPQFGGAKVYCNLGTYK